ncbi:MULTISPECIES: hypothetical protein [unclassified Vibrio]|uniref:hypothetical protein n=1 Tax=unclassified Vibrio TaxID=2614977 RepID=UPI0035537267
MLSNKHAAISIIALTLLMGCKKDKDEGGSNPNDVAGRSNTHVNVTNLSQPMTLFACKDTTSLFASEDFIVGTPNGANHDTIKNILRATQVAFDLHVKNENFDKLHDLDLDGTRMEICVDRSEGSNGAGRSEGVTLGDGRSGANLDLLLDHELVHLLTDRLSKNPYAMFFGRWIDEGLAEMLSGDSKVNKSQMNALISMPSNSGYLNDSLTPPEIMDKGDEDTWTFSGKNFGHFYPSYNTTLHFLFSQGATRSDIWNFYKLAGQIAESCEEQMIEAYWAEHDGTYSPVGWHTYERGSVACQTEFNHPEHEKYATKWNGELVGNDDFHVFVFNKAMAHTGITYDYLVENFRPLVVDGYLK